MSEKGWKMNVEFWCKDVLYDLKDECKLKKSNFMERMIDFDKSLFLYYKKYKDINKYFKNHSWYHYIGDIYDLFLLKKYLKEHNYKKYIDKYLHDNEGWYSADCIPKNKNGLEIKIINTMNKQMNVYMCGYGFREKKDPCSTFGWICWVKCWKFINDKDNNIEKIEYRKGFKKSK